MMKCIFPIGNPWTRFWRLDPPCSFIVRRPESHAKSTVHIYLPYSGEVLIELFHDDLTTMTGAAILAAILEKFPDRHELGDHLLMAYCATVAAKDEALKK
eukprot:GHVU01179557.1.p1 GENE.GHVU01179557.1~~GHVU01179557.1.p1  ORF type:complete len:100 (+),score=10.21 GHVU01179557.1:309-608(+)